MWCVSGIISAHIMEALISLRYQFTSCIESSVQNDRRNEKERQRQRHQQLSNDSRNF